MAHFTIPNCKSSGFNFAHKNRINSYFREFATQTSFGMHTHTHTHKYWIKVTPMIRKANIAHTINTRDHIHFTRSWMALYLARIRMLVQWILASCSHVMLSTGQVLQLFSGNGGECRCACVCMWTGLPSLHSFSPHALSLSLSLARSRVETSKSETFSRVFATTNQLIQIVFDIDAGPMSIYQKDSCQLIRWILCEIRTHTQAHTWETHVAHVIRYSHRPQILIRWMLQLNGMIETDKVRQISAG